MSETKSSRLGANLLCHVQVGFWALRVLNPLHAIAISVCSYLGSGSLEYFAKGGSFYDSCCIAVGQNLIDNSSRSIARSLASV